MPRTIFSRRGSGELKLTDIIPASGDVYSGEKVIATESGKYNPAVIDFTKKNARKRLAEIREAAEKGEPVHDVLKGLFRQVLKCQNIDEFEAGVTVLLISGFLSGAGMKCPSYALRQSGDLLFPVFPKPYSLTTVPGFACRIPLNSVSRLTL